jgi:hypothetical protein
MWSVSGAGIGRELSETFLNGTELSRRDLRMSCFELLKRLFRATLGVKGSETRTPAQPQPCTWSPTIRITAARAASLVSRLDLVVIVYVDVATGDLEQTFHALVASRAHRAQ